MKEPIVSRRFRGAIHFDANLLRLRFGPLSAPNDRLTLVVPIVKNESSDEPGRIDVLFYPKEDTSIARKVFHVRWQRRNSVYEPAMFLVHGDTAFATLGGAVTFALMIFSEC